MKKIIKERGKKMPILLKLTADNAEKLCEICNEFECDINVINGSTCVDGKSLIGVTHMANHVVQLSPVTFDDYVVETFFRKVEPLGAYKEAY